MDVTHHYTDVDKNRGRGGDIYRNRDINNNRNGVGNRNRNIK